MDRIQVFYNILMLVVMIVAGRTSWVVRLTIHAVLVSSLLLFSIFSLSS